MTYIMKEFEIRPDLTKDYKVSCLLASKIGRCHFFSVATYLF